MSFNSSSGGSGSRTSRRTFEFGRTHVVRPKGKHQATIVWLHGLGDKGSSWSQLLETLPLPNIKWICPTAPTRPVAIFGGFPCTAWFDVGDISEDAPDDLEGLDASAAHVANLLSTEPPDSRTLKNRLESSHDVARRAASLPILLCHGLGDDVVAYKHGEKSAQTLSSVGFRNLTFRIYNGLGHYTIPEETEEVCNWLTARLGLEGSRS
ncbi:alpha/beta-Hydrolases superfamily protein [Actinidia rufa]|uniref:Alpha/beta-Hydrolases superfamily protein n=1 Tax=Actinidia rufa TaxID=165716 RepID=A0A7J0DVL2_9ERIC|nr:alpha/beta-Hydrolases superfamily protein [Actinidia rufa]